ncbi:MAG: hypothetical protein WD030_01895 [Pirellulales bacterium]
MSLKQRLSDELDVCVNQSTGGLLLRAAHGALTMQVDLDSIETVGCMLKSITIESTDLADASIKRLHEISESLTKRISYLMEPLAEIECDDQRCTVQLRSNPPQQEGNRRAYYELLVQRGGLVTLTRYEKSNGAARTAVPAQLTREVLLRLVGDMEAALE